MNYKLKDICTRISSGKNKKSEEIKDVGKFPVYGGNGIRGFSDEYNFDGECVIVGRQGANCGNVRYFAGKAFMTDHAVVICTDGKTNTKYLSYLLSGLELGRLSGQAAQPGISVGVLSKQSIDLPSLDYQNKVVRKISLYDDLIANNNKRIKILEKMAENLYQEWFVRFRFPGYETAEFVDGVPKGWKREHIEYFYDTSSGGTPSRSNEQNYIDGTIPWIKTGEIKDTIIVDTDEHITDLALKNSSAKLFPKDTVIMAMYGVNIGKLGYLGDNMACNQAACVFVDKSTINSKHYLFQLLKSMREYLLNIGFGAAQQNLSQQLINKIKITMPDKFILELFEDAIEPMYQSIKILNKQNQNLTKQRDYLLPRLMSGKLQVK